MWVFSNDDSVIGMCSRSVKAPLVTMCAGSVQEDSVPRCLADSMACLGTAARMLFDVSCMKYVVGARKSTWNVNSSSARTAKLSGGSLPELISSPFWT